jgi:autotransporter passenger strand-loop-strand repeat protein
VISAGGRQQILAGAVDSGPLVATGGLEFVFSTGGVADPTISGGTLELPSGSAQVFGPITFTGPGLLTIDAGTPAAVVAGFEFGDGIDFVSLPPAAAIVSLVGGNTLIGGLTIAGIFPSAGPGALSLNPDGLGGTMVTVACFAAGTHIATEQGEVPIQKIRRGDRVCSAAGGAVEVIWVGSRRIHCKRYPRPQDASPVRIERDAFHGDRPHRPLFLSPDHALFLNGVLIPVRYLLNGASIAQVAVDEIDYFHIELADHGVILAEGLPAESYLDTGNRLAFRDAAPIAAPPVALSRAAL